MTWQRLFTPAGAMVALLGTCISVTAQGLPRPPGAIPGGLPPAMSGGQQQVCLRLESQLAAIDRGTSDPTRAAQIGRYEDAIRRQQAQLDQTTLRSRRLGCERTGLFALFRNQPPECASLTRQIQRMHSSIDRLMSQLQQARGGTADRESRRRSVLIALAENDCGPQYRAVTANRSRGFFDNLFGPGSIVSPEPLPDVPLSGTYRTLCVRTCDGYYWPISFSTVPGRFAEDERTCQGMCPAAQVTLFTHRNPGEDVEQAVSLTGYAYRDLPSAFLYRKQFDPACSCKRAGETWANALQHLDDKVERGDIVVTEERAKQLSKPREQRSSRSGSREERNAAPQPDDARDTAPPLRGSSDSAAKENKVRNVGPIFLPKQ